MSKIKDFVKTHKKEIVAGVAMVVVGGCGYAIGKRVGLNGYFKKETKLLDGSTACPGFYIEATEPLTVGDLGKLGEAFLKHDSELTKDTKILEIGQFAFE